MIYNQKSIYHYQKLTQRILNNKIIVIKNEHYLHITFDNTNSFQQQQQKINLTQLQFKQ